MNSTELCFDIVKRYERLYINEMWLYYQFYGQFKTWQITSQITSMISHITPMTFLIVSMHLERPTSSSLYPILIS